MVASDTPLEHVHWFALTLDERLTKPSPEAVAVHRQSLTIRLYRAWLRKLGVDPAEIPAEVYGLAGIPPPAD